MKNLQIIAVAVCALTARSMQAQDKWTIENKTYTVDTIYHATVGPGTTETELRITNTEGSTERINNIFYTVTDLSNPYIEMRAAKGGNHMRMLETVPDIAERMSAASEDYFTGVNADFFNMSYPYNPIGMCIANGFLTNHETDGADIFSSYIIFNDKNEPFIVSDITRDWYGSATMPEGSSYSVKVNDRRGESELVLYTPQWQFYDSWANKTWEKGSTGTNQYGVEISLKPIGDNILYGSTLSLEVTSEPEEAVGNMAIPQDGYVLSAHGDARPLLRKLKKGDVVKVSMGFTADNKPVRAKEVLGGCPIILDNGQVTPTGSDPDHLKNLEPRTAVGYNSDKSKLYMLVVDGRNAGGSSGVTQRELGYIMKNVGCTRAMNFDGGGSSTMYVKGLGIKNIPSTSSLDNRKEGQPRTVVNALYAVAISPVDNVISSIELRDKKVNLTSAEKYEPVVYGYNQYGALVSTDVSGCTFTISPEIATVEGNILTAAAEGHLSGVLTAEYGTSKYSVPVYLNGGGNQASIKDITTDGNSETEAEYYRLDGVKISHPQKGQINVVRQGGKSRLELESSK